MKAQRELDVQDRVIYVVSGTAQVQVNTLVVGWQPIAIMHIPATTPHQITNAGFEPLVYMSLIITDPVHGTRGTRT